MSKKESGNVIIDGGIIERIVNLCEGSVKKMEEREDIKKNEFNYAKDFIKEQMERVAAQMRATDILDAKYKELVRVYDSLVNIVRFW